MISNDEIARALAPLLLRPLRPQERLKIAAVLESLAAQQRELAAADTHKGGRPKGSGGRFVRYAPGAGSRSGQLHIASALWHELGDPPRLDVQRVGGTLRLAPADGEDGYAVGLPTGARGGMPRINIGQSAAETLRLAAGRVDAEIAGGAIVAR